MTQKANYIIGAPWPKGDGAICEYSYWGVVHHGTMAEAENLLGEVKQRVEANKHDRSKYQPKAEDFQIYQVVPIK